VPNARPVRDLSGREPVLTIVVPVDVEVPEVSSGVPGTVDDPDQADGPPEADGGSGAEDDLGA
jgi:hypothetical protein